MYILDHFKGKRLSSTQSYLVVLFSVEYVAQLHCRFVLSLFGILVTLDNVMILSLRVAGLSCLPEHHTCFVPLPPSQNAVNRYFV